MENREKDDLKKRYHEALIKDVVPFWLEKSVDWEYGGYMDFLDRNGKPLSTDKGGWVQGRAVWVFSTLYRDIENRQEWLRAAANGVRFIRQKLRRKSDGRMYFEVTRDGKPLIMRRYLFTEMFAAMGLAAYSEITNDKKCLQEARDIYHLIFELQDKMEPKINPGTRQLRGHSFTMMIINLCQVMRQADPENAAEYSSRIDNQIEELFRYFVKPELKVLLETVGPNGELTEGTEGRCVNPGHTIETVWFILEEARFRNNKDLTERILPLLDWSMEIGWDKKKGGLFSFIDYTGRQPAQVEWDMKYWWPHCEALYALLLAYSMTGNDQYAEWFRKVDNYTWSHFPDKEGGEWFGYLRRDGSVQVTLKGNHFKGPFHIPRALLKCFLLMDSNWSFDTTPAGNYRCCIP